MTSLRRSLIVDLTGGSDVIADDVIVVDRTLQLLQLFHGDLPHLDLNTEYGIPFNVCVYLNDDLLNIARYPIRTRIAENS